MDTVEQRLTRLENQVNQLLERRRTPGQTPWWDRHFGAFKDDPLFDQAVQLGEEYRRSQPNPADSPDAVRF